MRTSLSRVPTNQSGVLELITQMPHRGEVGLVTEGSSNGGGRAQVMSQGEDRRSPGRDKESVCDLA